MPDVGTAIAPGPLRPITAGARTRSLDARSLGVRTIMEKLFFKMARTLRSGRGHLSVPAAILLGFCTVIFCDAIPASAQERVMFTATDDALHEIVQRINAEQVRVD